MEEINAIIKKSQDQASRKEHDTILFEPIRQYSKMPVYPYPMRICQAYNHWFKVPEDKFKVIHEITDEMFTAILMADDILDDSKYRENIPVSQYLFGVPRTLKGVHFIIFNCLRKLQNLNNPKATNIFIDQLLELNYGEGIAVYWRSLLKIPTEFEYKSNALYKTGGLFTLSLKLLQLFSTNEKDFSKLSAMMAIYFQIWNDYCDVNVAEYTGQKEFCRDITEGNYSFPILHAIRQEAPGTEILNILEKKTDDVVIKSYCLGLIQKNGGIKYTKEVLNSMKGLISQEIDRLGSNPPLKQLLSDVLDF